MSSTESEVAGAVAGVVDPELGRPLGELGMLREVRARRRRTDVVVALPPGYPSRDDLSRRILEVLGAGGTGLRDTEVRLAPMTEAELRSLRARMSEPGAGGEARSGPGSLSRARVLGISSGKGGVGKSSVTVNLSVALARLGHRVAVLDADVYGFSIPSMLGIRHDPMVVEDIVVPPTSYGVRCMSIGYFVGEDQPVMWRGPMLHKALEQFVKDVYWGDPDWLVVDMPPGTGDVALSMAEHLPRAEVLVVTTPQSAAQRVAQRSAHAARKLKLPVRGVVENMSWFTAGDDGRHEIFGSGGGARLASELGVPLLAQVPLDPRLREGGDQGLPVAVADPEGEASLAFEELAKRVSSMNPARLYRSELKVR
jgi:ATP-binding protein involved in chromosome partitioning